MQNLVILLLLLSLGRAGVVKAQQINNLFKKPDQMHSTNKQYLHVLVLSLMNNVVHYQGPSSPWNSQAARYSPFRKPLGFLFCQCSRLDIECVDSNLKDTCLPKLNVKINTILRSLGHVVYFYSQVCFITLPSVYRMPNVFILSPLRQDSCIASPNWTVE